MRTRWKQPLISVCIPAYEMHGKGAEFLVSSLDILTQQTLKNFEVIVSDNSKTKAIYGVCRKYRKILNLSYFKNHDAARGMATNINNSIKNASGKLIKILFLDDFLIGKNALKIIVSNFNLKKDHWLLTGYTHSTNGVNFFSPGSPKYNDQIYLGKNTIGSPSILTVKNDSPLLFDVRLKWFVDCDYYKRCYQRFGPPKIISDVLTVIRTGSHQVTNTEITKSVETNEREYLEKKHDKKPTSDLNLNQVTLVAVSAIAPEKAARALELSMKGVNYYDVILISHFRPKNLDDRITFRQCLPTELENKDPKNKNDYSRFIAYSLCHYIDSDFALIVHNDAFVLRPSRWSKDFLKYDYIGAPWPKNLHFTSDRINVRVGNGGFSLRSRRLLNILNKLKLPFTDNHTGYFNEDGLICVYHRRKLEENGIKFAPVNVASQFSHERNCDDSDPEPFGYHNNRKVIPRYFFLKYYLRKYMRLPC